MAIGRKLEFEKAEAMPDSSTPTFSGGRKIEFKPKEISRLRSLLSAFPKGVATEFLDVARGIRGIVGLEERPEAKATRSFIEEHLPTRPEFTEKALERAGHMAPYAAIPGGGGLAGGLARTGLAGFAGQAAEEMGAGPLGQAGAEIAAFGLPSLGRKIIPTKGQEKLVQFARKAGLSEKQIAPLLPSKKKQAFFGKVASKGEKTQEALKSTREGIGQAYEFVKTSPAAQSSLSPQSIQKFLNDSANIAMQMPFEIRKQVAQDAADLLRAGPTGSNLINFYQDISSRYKLGREQLERLKGPILEALESISPQLAEDFKLTNELFKKGLAARKTLKPNISSELIDLGELGVLANSVITGSMKGLVNFMGLGGVRKFAREMLINPKLQNITKQMQKAANERKWSQVERLMDYILNKYSEED